VSSGRHQRNFENCLLEKNYENLCPCIPCEISLQHANKVQRQSVIFGYYDVEGMSNFAQTMSKKERPFLSFWRAVQLRLVLA
jgi:hypothetical protein